MNVKLNDERVKLIAATTGAFALGAAAGILSGMSYFKKKFEAIADEEIESVKETYRAKQRQEEPCEEQADGGYAATAEEAMDNYRSILTETYGPSPFDEEDDVVPVDQFKMPMDERVKAKPYIIDEREAGECEGYPIASLTYYSDYILADENDEPVDDVEGYVGADALLQLKVGPSDVVYVRNDRLGCDFEIMADLRRYADIPHEDEDL